MKKYKEWNGVEVMVEHNGEVLFLCFCGRKYGKFKELTVKELIEKWRNVLTRLDD